MPPAVNRRPSRLIRPQAVCIAALLGALLAVGPAAAGSARLKTRVFSSGPINRPIPDVVGIGGVEIAPSIRVLARGRVRDVNVAVRISHPRARDLDLDASHIPGDGVLTATNLKEHGSLADPLGADFGGGAAACAGADFTVFDSQAQTSILQGAPPFVGPFSPLVSLAAFNRTELRGRWYLDILDTEPGAAGTINCWKLKVTYRPRKRGRKGQGPRS